MKAVFKFLAKRCENCPLCRHAREHPDTFFGKVMAFHGKFCPFWKAWEREYGRDRAEGVNPLTPRPPLPGERG